MTFLLSWRNSGFSIDNSVRLTDVKRQESPSEYISRPPLSLKKMRYEPSKGKVLFHTKHSDYFGPTHRVDRKLCTCLAACILWPNSRSMCRPRESS